MTPTDFEHLDDLTSTFDDASSFSISIVRHARTGRLYVEILHGQDGDRYAYVPADLPEQAAGWDGVWEGIAKMLGTEAGR